MKTTMYLERFWNNMNKTFYNTFENRALKGLRLDHLQPEDFKILKNLGIKRQNIRMLNKLMNRELEDESDYELWKPFKELK